MAEAGSRAGRGPGLTPAVPGQSVMYKNSPGPFPTGNKPTAWDINKSSSNDRSRRGGAHPPQRGSQFQRTTGAHTWAQWHQNGTQKPSHFLESLCQEVVSKDGISREEIAAKEAFRIRAQDICRDAISKHLAGLCLGREPPLESIQLTCFGSLSSGFAIAGSDMDLGLVITGLGSSLDIISSPIPRLMEKALLDHGIGAKLLTRARVPILKVFENPSKSLMESFVRERQKFEAPERPDTGALYGGHDAGTTLTEDGNAAATSNKHPAQSQDDSVLKQSVGMSLSRYYEEAKARLRRLGACDITSSTWPALETVNLPVLEHTCRQFVLGLECPLVRRRLTESPLFSSRRALGETPIRSLHSVYIQARGETLLLLRDQRGLKERSPDREREMDAAVSTWEALQSPPDPHDGPFVLAWKMQRLVEKLEAMPSIMLAQPEQGNNEMASQHQSRVKDCLHQLGASHLWYRPLSESEGLADRFVSGIRDTSIRNAVWSWMEAGSSSDFNLETIGVFHRCLELVQCLKAAMDESLYSPAEIPDILQYTLLMDNVLRTHPAGIQAALGQLVGNARGLLRKIATMPSPFPLIRSLESLEPPAHAVGARCDINFAPDLALQNTRLLRCYTHCDSRVRPLVIFVKRWAKARKINSPYRGTLSSYGYVLMVLHYLVNVVQPFVCPNLQLLRKPSQPGPPQAVIPQECGPSGTDNIHFWSDETEIIALAARGQINHNSDSIGLLLCGFFEYYAHPGPMTTTRFRGFDWRQDVLSLRSPGGLLTKSQKGWTVSRTEAHVPMALTEPVSPSRDNSHNWETPENVFQQNNKEVREVRHRFLFAIEDPFELDHNIARTVNHPGIVSIRDEFRRAWSIIRTAGTDKLLGDLVGDKEGEDTTLRPLLEQIHGL